MLITPMDPHLRLITQVDHAAWAAELLTLWRGDGLPEHPRRDALLFAVREHDNGWQEADSAPYRSADGRPHDFRSLPPPLRLEIWRRGIERHHHRPYVAALIAQHALELHRQLAGDPAWSAPLEDWREQRDAWLEDCGEDLAALESDYRFLQLADLLSLVVCTGSEQPGTIGGGTIDDDIVEQRRYALSHDGDTAILSLEPFPLAGTTSFEIAYRHIEDRAYANGVELAVALASARWSKLHVKVASG